MSERLDTAALPFGGVSPWLDRLMRRLPAILLWLAAAQPANAAPPAATLSPDSSSVLISRDIAGQRWLVVQNLVEGTLSGNVYDPTDGSSRFVWCTLAPRPLESGLAYRCSGATNCAADDCSKQWDPIRDVVVPQSFFRAGTFAATLEGLKGRWSGRDGYFATFSDPVPGQRPGVLMARLSTSEQAGYVHQVGGQFELLDPYAPVLAFNCHLYRFNEIAPGVISGLALAATLERGTCTATPLFVYGPLLLFRDGG